MTPTRYRAGGASTEIRFADRRVLARRHPGRRDRARRVRDPPRRRSRRAGPRPAGPLPPRPAHRRRRARSRQLVAKVVGFVEAPALGLDLPLDVRGTAFQQRVWQALRAIPAGATASYAEIAERDRRAEGRARRGAGLRGERARRRDPLPPRGAERRRALGLPLGRRAQARAARARGAARERAARGGRPAGAPAGAAERVASIDWTRAARGPRRAGLRGARASAARDECEALAALYDGDAPFAAAS